MADDSAWIFLQFDEKTARRGGMPTQVPVQKRDMELIAESGLQAAHARKSIAAFLREAPSSWRTQNAALAARFDLYVGKAIYAEKAEVSVATGDVEGAIKALGMVVRLDKEDHGARMNLGIAHARKGDFAAARRELDLVEGTFEGDTEYHCLRGQVLLAASEKEAALEQFVLALEAEPTSKQALEGLVKLGALVAIYEDPRDAASLAYLRADAVAEHLASLWAELGERANLIEQLAYHESEQRHDVVLAAAKALLARENTSDAHRERAETACIHALRELGQKEEAMMRAKALVAERPNSAHAHVELARCYAQAGDPESGRSELDRALAIDPGDALALRLRFWPADSQDLLAVQASLGTLEEYARKHPTVAGAQRSVARAKLVLGATDEALALFESAVRLAPEDDDLRAEFWVELTKVGREPEVIADAERVSDLAKRGWTLRWAEAEAYARLGRKSEANAAFTALAADPSLDVSLRKRARRAAARAAGG